MALLFNWSTSRLSSLRSPDHNRPRPGPTQPNPTILSAATVWPNPTQPSSARATAKFSSSFRKPKRPRPENFASTRFGSGRVTHPYRLRPSPLDLPLLPSPSLPPPLHAARPSKRPRHRTQSGATPRFQIPPSTRAPLPSFQFPPLLPPSLLSTLPSPSPPRFRKLPEGRRSEPRGEGATWEPASGSFNRPPRRRRRRQVSQRRPGPRRSSHRPILLLLPRRCRAPHAAGLDPPHPRPAPTPGRAAPPLASSSYCSIQPPNPSFTPVPLAHGGGALGAALVGRRIGEFVDSIAIAERGKCASISSTPPPHALD